MLGEAEQNEEEINHPYNGKCQEMQRKLCKENK
jgi:hypothetical protein